MVKLKIFSSKKKKKIEIKKQAKSEQAIMNQCTGIFHLVGD